MPPLASNKTRQDFKPVDYRFETRPIDLSCFDGPLDRAASQPFCDWPLQSASRGRSPGLDSIPTTSGTRRSDSVKLSSCALKGEPIFPPGYLIALSTGVPAQSLVRLPPPPLARSRR